MLSRFVIHQESICQGALSLVRPIPCHLVALFADLVCSVYPTQQSYENTRIDEASFLELVPDMSGTIMSIADEDRSECAYLLPSNPPVCQDTRNAKSVSFFGRDFNRGTMTLYSNFGGRGVTMSLDYTSPSRQMVDGNWVAYGYLKGDWYKRYVQHM